MFDSQSNSDVYGCGIDTLRFRAPCSQPGPNVMTTSLLPLPLQLPAAVSAMELNRQGTVLVLNCTDKVIRLADVCARADHVDPLSQEEARAKLDALGVSH